MSVIKVASWEVSLIISLGHLRFYMGRRLIGVKLNTKGTGTRVPRSSPGWAISHFVTTTLGSWSFSQDQNRETSIARMLRESWRTILSSMMSERASYSRTYSLVKELYRAECIIADSRLALRYTRLVEWARQARSLTSSPSSIIKPITQQRQWLKEASTFWRECIAQQSLQCFTNPKWMASMELET